MGSEQILLSHLRADARWCAFREVATNRIPGSQTIRVYECACGIPLRMVELDATPDGGGPITNVPDEQDATSRG